MRTIDKHVDLEGISRVTYSHFDCVSYIFESLDLLYEKLESSERSSSLITYLNTFYHYLKDEYNRISIILNDN